MTYQTSSPATPPDATVVATDDVSGVQYQRVKVDLGGDGSASPLVRGQQADASSIPVTLSTEGTAQLGSLTETAPATDTASSGLNGRLQRIAQRLTSILAKLPALGTAGSASSDVITIQGIASMTAVKVDASGTAVPITDNSGSLTVDNNGTFAVQADTELTTADLDTGAGTDTRAVVGLVLAASGGAVALAGNSGNKSDGTVRMVIATDQPQLTNALKVDGSAVAQPVTDNSGSLTVDAPVGTPVFVRLSDGSSAIATLPVSLASVPSHAVTNAGTFAVQAVLRPETSGGLSTFMASGSDGSTILQATAQVIKASAGQLYGYYAYNPEAAVSFVHFYNTAAASVTVGTTNPLFTIAIPAGSAANLMFGIGVAFSNAGWSCAATTTAGGNTSPATGVSLVAWYT